MDKETFKAYFGRQSTSGHVSDVAYNDAFMRLHQEGDLLPLLQDTLEFAESDPWGAYYLLRQPSRSVNSEPKQPVSDEEFEALMKIARKVTTENTPPFQSAELSGEMMLTMAHFAGADEQRMQQAVTLYDTAPDTSGAHPLKALSIAAREYAGTHPFLTDLAISKARAIPAIHPASDVASRILITNTDADSEDFAIGISQATRQLSAGDIIGDLIDVQIRALAKAKNPAHVTTIADALAGNIAKGGLNDAWKNAITSMMSKSGLIDPEKETLDDALIRLKATATTTGGQKTSAKLGKPDFI